MSTTIKRDSRAATAIEIDELEDQQRKLTERLAEATKHGEGRAVLDLRRRLEDLPTLLVAARLRLARLDLPLLEAQYEQEIAALPQMQLEADRAREVARLVYLVYEEKVREYNRLANEWSFANLHQDVTASSLDKLRRRIAELERGS